RARVAALHLLEQLRSVHARHAHVGDDHVVGPRVELVEGGGASDDEPHLPFVPPAAKTVLKPCQDVRLVVDEEEPNPRATVPVRDRGHAARRKRSTRPRRSSAVRASSCAEAVIWSDDADVCCVDAETCCVDADDSSATAATSSVARTMPSICSVT